MFNTLIAATESLRVDETDIDVALSEMDLAIADAEASDAVLKDIVALETFGGLVRTTTDAASLIALADVDGGLSALFGVPSTEALIEIAQEELADSAEQTASAAADDHAKSEDAEEGEETAGVAGAKAANKKKWAKVAVVGGAALLALAGGIAAYKIRKNNVPDAVRGRMLGQINALRKEARQEPLDELPENPAGEVAGLLRSISRGKVTARQMAEKGTGADSAETKGIRASTAASWKAAARVGREFKADAAKLSKATKKEFDAKAAEIRAKVKAGK